MKLKTILVDLDGTLANIDHRLKYAKGRDKDWGKFSSLVYEDTPNQWCVNLVQLYHKAGYQIIFMSGREEKARENTVRWLNDKCNIQPYMYKLYMRPNRNFQDDTIIKEMLYNENVKDHYDVEIVVDDRPKVIRMWRKLGLTVLACNDKEF